LHLATFYDRYPDKFSLLEYMVAGQFQELLNARGTRFDTWKRRDCRDAVTPILKPGEADRLLV
jgi:AcrR family transcriptional regulator